MEAIRRMVREMIQEMMVDEMSGFSRAMNVMRGNSKSVDRFVIVTAANPNAEQKTNDFNNRAMEQLYADVRSKGYGFIKMKGLYGVPEPSILINGMTREEGAELASKYEQQSYIYAERKPLDKEGSYMHYELIYPNDQGQNVSSKALISNVDVQGLEDFYSSIKGRKFQIPFYNDMFEKKVIPVGSSKAVDMDEPNNLVMKPAL